MVWRLIAALLPQWLVVFSFARLSLIRANACVAASEGYLPATDCTPINASCYSILKSEPHCIARANIAGFPLLIGLRFLTSWSHELGTYFRSTLIGQRLFVG